VRPVLFSVLVIIVALIPLFTMQGVPGKIFAPMSETTASLLLAPLCLPSCWHPCSLHGESRRESAPITRVSSPGLNKRYASSLRWTLTHRKTALVIAGAGARRNLCARLVPRRRVYAQLEEGNLWVRATLPQDVSYESSAKTGARHSRNSAQFPRCDPGRFAGLAGPTTARTSPLLITSSSWFRSRIRRLGPAV